MKIISLKKFSSIYQFFGRTVASTETNDTSTEIYDTLLFGAEKSDRVALSLIRRSLDLLATKRH